MCVNAGKRDIMYLFKILFSSLFLLSLSTVALADVVVKPINPAIIMYLLSSTDSQSGPGTDIIAPTVPLDMNSTAVSSSQINLSWSASTDDVGVVGYKIYQRVGEQNIFIVDTNSLSYSINNLDSATQYCYEVTAYNAAGNESAYSSYSCSKTDGTGTGEYTLLAWNDLGMHCMDGSDFSVFSILPPYNVLQAQLIKKVGTSNKHVTTGVTLSYQAMDYNGHVNTTSDTKTNFWHYADQLFPGTHLVANYGLNGFRTPTNTIDSNMTFNATENWFEAVGIPIINRDDDNLTNYYPLVRVTARDNTTGVVLATAEVVLPVSDEMDCARCHASTTSTGPAGDAKPTAGWEFNTQNPVVDFKLNILKLHDENHPISQTDLDALATKGFNYQTSLYNTAKAGTPILCASCHRDISLGATGQGTNGISSFTQAIHSKHADVLDPVNGLKLDNSTNRTSCYACHPGATTECLRGAMGDPVDGNGDQLMQCQSCHGNLSDVGSVTRTEWTNVPNCQACHENGSRHTSALVNGTLRNTSDTRFATNANTPSPGTSVYRFSTGHGDLSCEACHGSTHAIFPSRQVEDNLQSISVQGHAGTIAECTSCHTSMPSTTNKGPHGMHTVGQNWVHDHEDVAERNSAQCTTCHGSDYRGSALSKTFSARTFRADGKTKSYQAGAVVGCYDCHNKKW